MSEVPPILCADCQATLNVDRDGKKMDFKLTIQDRTKVFSDDPRVVKELQVTAYHVLWELVHVFFEQPGVLGPGVVT
jgi:D-sedoheptulose 7-phosphate isomerase